jgi:hypothetical protein
MIWPLIIRFVVGGALVSLFALAGDVFKPKTFAGLFGAAPAIALATLVLSIHTYGAAYGRVEARSEVIGAVALFVCASAISASLHRWRTRVAPTVFAALLVWFGIAAVGWALLVRRA